MKITAVKTHLCKEAHRNLIFVVVETDDGLFGVGEAYSVGPDNAVACVVEHFEPWLVGEDPRNIEGLWHKLCNFSRFPGGFIMMSAISGIDIALWDLSGKMAGIPVWQLLGGKCRERVRTYGHVHGDSPEALADNARRLVDRYGFDAVKCFPFSPGGNYWKSENGILPPRRIALREAERRMTSLRKELGDDIDIAVDMHAALYNPSDAADAVRMLEQFDPLFVEEPLRPDSLDALVSLRRSVHAPLATGEMLYTKWSFHDLLARDAADIVQPDICIAGGMTETRKIAVLAETFGAHVAPHNPMGPVATAANVHLCAAIPNALILEYIPDDTSERTDIVNEPLRFSNGWLEIPDSPGLGIELDIDGVSKHPPQEWHRTFRYRNDGASSHI